MRGLVTACFGSQQMDASTGAENGQRGQEPGWGSVSGRPNLGEDFLGQGNAGLLDLSLVPVVDVEKQTWSESFDGPTRPAEGAVRSGASRPGKGARDSPLAADTLIFHTWCHHNRKGPSARVGVWRGGHA